MCEKMKQVIFIFPHKILLGLLRLPPPSLLHLNSALAHFPWLLALDLNLDREQWAECTAEVYSGWFVLATLGGSRRDRILFFFFFFCPGWAAGRPETESYLEVINIFSCPNGLEFLRHWSCNHNITGSSPAISYPLPTVCHLHKAKKMGVCSQISVKIVLILHRSEKSTVLRQRVLLPQYSIVSSSWPACFSF